MQMISNWRERPYVYVAGSYDTGDKNVNLQRAFSCAENVVKKNGIPIVPHMCHLWHSKFYFHKREFWLNYSMSLLVMCRFMVVCPGSEFSPGVADERTEALLRGIVVYNYDEFLVLEAFPMVLKELPDGSRLDSVEHKDSDDAVQGSTVSGDVVDKAASEHTYL